MRDKPYPKLRGRIREIYGRQADLAKAMEMNSTTLSMKLNGLRDWTRLEMERACILLEIPINEVHLYFYI